MTTDQAVDWVDRLHGVVDGLVRDLVAGLGGRISCRRGCAGCCQDDLTVHPAEAELIRRRHPALLATGAPHPPGACAMLDPHGACRVYAERPYVCRTQGLPLRWAERDPGHEVRELRDICPLNAAGTPVEALPAEACWTIGPVETRLAAVLPETPRVPLRSLFASPPART